jgi:type II secretory pathway component PulL
MLGVAAFLFLWHGASSFKYWHTFKTALALHKQSGYLYWSMAPDSYILLISIGNHTGRSAIND